jgi:hypothetical protein
MPGSTDHHFLPQSYLRGFASNRASKSRQKVWCISKAEAPQCVEPFIKDIGFEKHFHTVTRPDGAVDSDSVETAVARLESLYAGVRQRVLDDLPLTADDRDLLARFVCLMQMRQPRQKRLIDEMRTTSAQEMVRSLTVGRRLEEEIALHAKYAHFPPAAIADLARRARAASEGGRLRLSNPNGALLADMFGTAFDPRLVALYKRMSLDVFTAPSTAVFITGDQPVIRFDPATTRSLLYGTGLANPRVEVTFPLSKNKLLRFSWKGVNEKKAASLAELEEFNRRAVVMAERQLFASRCDEQVLRIIHQHHRWSAGDEFTATRLPDGRLLAGSRSVAVRPSQFYERSDGGAAT